MFLGGDQRRQLLPILGFFICGVVPLSAATMTSAEELDFNTPPTALGVFGTANANLIAFLGAPASRVILWDSQITPANGPAIIQGLQQKRAAGIGQTIVTLRWPVDEGANSFFDRIPANPGAELAKLDTFLAETEGLIDWIQIQNEPFGGPGSYADLAELGLAVNWWIAVAERIEAYNVANGTNIGIISPALTGFGLAIEEGSLTAQAVHSGIVDFANTYCDALDMHLHTTDVGRLRTIIDYVDTIDPAPSVPKVVLEWSQARAVLNYIAEPANDVFLDAIYAGTPVSVGDWRAFIDAAPLDPGFIAGAMRLFQEREFLVACYATVLQFSEREQDRHFDVTALYAQIATGAINPNQPIFDQFRALSSEAQRASARVAVSSVAPGPLDTTVVGLRFPVQPATTYQLYLSEGDLNSWVPLGAPFSSYAAVDAEIEINVPSPVATPKFFKLELGNPVRNLP